MGGAQVCTVGRIELHPNYINVIPARATFTADLRNTDAARLREAEARFAAFLDSMATRTGTAITRRTLARFEPVAFDPRLVAMIEDEAGAMGLRALRMTSGAGHDAQMMARICPSAMIFVPSIAGISHNPAERTRDADLVAGADLLLRTLATLAKEA
jgi:N-carbamoyl-L-amino-acid hydrolase